MSLLITLFSIYQESLLVLTYRNYPLISMDLFNAIGFYRNVFFEL